MPETHDVTLLLTGWAKGNQKALDDLTPLVYRELRQLAAGYLRRERQGHTLQPTALVHEAYLRLVDQSNPNWQNRSHFYGVAARLMRQILVDHARRKRAGKRAGVQVPLEQTVIFERSRSRDLIALDAGLAALEKIDPRKCKTVELHYFGGLSTEEIAAPIALRSGVPGTSDLVGEILGFLDVSGVKSGAQEGWIQPFIVGFTKTGAFAGRQGNSRRDAGLVVAFPLAGPVETGEVRGGIVIVES
jgi:RNA polymerase sigma-70 factor, ECF subfamily